MKILKLEISSLQIPFKVAFSHASATRNKTETVLVKAVCSENIIGFGEGCPRSYVTGESIKSAFAFFESVKTEVSAITSLSELKTFVTENRKIIDTSPAAWCAIESALLDVLATERKESLEAFLQIKESKKQLHYTAVLGAQALNTFQKQVKKYTTLEFKDYKVKISGNQKEDRERLETLLKSSKGLRLRADANNLWQTSDEAVGYIRSLNTTFSALEEPLKAKDYKGCRELSKELNTPIILDESFLKLEQLNQLREDPTTWILNLRVSKLGGLLRTLEILNEAEKIGLQIILGAQVGESSLLTRAAIVVANASKNSLFAQEGAYGTHLLQHDVTETPIMFGAKGLLEPRPLLTNPGWGFKITIENCT